MSRQREERRQVSQLAAQIDSDTIWVPTMTAQACCGSAPSCSGWRKMIKNAVNHEYQLRNTTKVCTIAGMRIGNNWLLVSMDQIVVCDVDKNGDGVHSGGGGKQPIKPSLTFCPELLLPLLEC